MEYTHQHGILNRASLLANGAAFNDAVAIAHRLPGLQVGVHLSLNEGSPVLPASSLPSLTTREDSFHETIGNLVSLWLQGNLSIQEVRAEWRAQIDHVLAAGIKISHLDSHKHVHVLPPLLQVTASLAKEYDIRYIRCPLERFSWIIHRRGPSGVGFWFLARRSRHILRAEGFDFADNFAGVSYSGAMNFERLRELFLRFKNQPLEIMVHPAVVTPSILRLQERYAWAAKYRFAEELNALCDPQLSLLLGS